MRDGSSRRNGRRVALSATIGVRRRALRRGARAVGVTDARPTLSPPSAACSLIVAERVYCWGRSAGPPVVSPHPPSRGRAMRRSRSVAGRIGGGMFLLWGLRLLAALFVVVWEGSRCSARSAARTNNLDADERRRMINATIGISAVVGVGGDVFRLSRNELCDLTLVPVHSSAICCRERTSNTFNAGGACRRVARRVSLSVIATTRRWLRPWCRGVVRSPRGSPPPGGPA